MTRISSSESIAAELILVEGVVLVVRLVLGYVLVLAPVPPSTVVIVVIQTTAPALIISKVFVKIAAGDILLSWITWASIGVRSAYHRTVFLALPRFVETALNLFLLSAFIGSTRSGMCNATVDLKRESGSTSNPGSP